jgi:hypothetical protein
MSRARFVMQCPSCGAPVTDALRVCPYCAQPVTAEALGIGTRTEKQGHLTIDDAHVMIGAESGEQRRCPFCGAMSDAGVELCAHCGARLIIKSLFLRSLVIEKGGSLSVFSGGSVTIGRPGPAPRLTEAATQGDLETVKARINAGDELDAVDALMKTPLMLALEHGHDEVARFLIAMGANLDDRDAQGRTALDYATGELADVLQRAK